MMKNTTRHGAKLEAYVERLFKDMCKLRVRRNVVYSCRGVLTRRKRRAQIDVEYWDLHGRTIVECKYYSGAYVPAEDVEEFKRRLDLVRHNQAMMITNTGYTAGARQLAKRYGIKLVDGDRLKQMDYDRLSLFGMIKERFGKRRSLEEQISSIDLRKYEAKSYHSSRQYSLL